MFVLYAAARAQGGAHCVVLIAHRGRPGGNYQRADFSLEPCMSVLKAHFPDREVRAARARARAPWAPGAARWHFARWHLSATTPPCHAPCAAQPKRARPAVRACSALALLAPQVIFMPECVGDSVEAATRECKPGTILLLEVRARSFALSLCLALALSIFISIAQTTALFCSLSRSRLSIARARSLSLSVCMSLYRANYGAIFYCSLCLALVSLSHSLLSISLSLKRAFSLCLALALPLTLASV